MDIFAPRSLFGRTAPLVGAAVSGALVMALVASAIGSAHASPEYRVTVSKVAPGSASATFVAVGPGGQSSEGSNQVLSREGGYETALLVESRVGSGAWAPVTPGDAPDNGAFFGFGE